MPKEIIEGHEIKIPLFVCSHCGRPVINKKCGCKGHENGCKLIEDERKDQLEREGWSTEHDNSHTNEELAWAAACYAAPRSIFRTLDGMGGPYYEDPWPWVRKWDKRDKHSRLRQLVIAGALIAAEIDRIQSS